MMNAKLNLDNLDRLDGAITTIPAGHSSPCLQSAGPNGLPCELFVKVDAHELIADPTHADAANFLQHRILINQQYNHQDEIIRGATHRYTNLKADYLRQIIGVRLWTQLIPELLTIGLIDRSFYTPTKKCYGYRIGDAFVQRPIMIVECQDNRLRRRIQASRHEPSLHKLLDKTYRQLLNWLGQVCIPLEHWAQIQEHGYTRHIAQGGRLNRAEYFDFVQTQLLALQRHHYRFGVDDLGRVQTNVANLIKPAREHLTIQGQPLVEIDIACSQPVFMTGMLLKEYQSFSSGIHSGIHSTPVTDRTDRTDRMDFMHSSAMNNRFSYPTSYPYYLLPNIPNPNPSSLIMCNSTEVPYYEDITIARQSYPKDVEKWLKNIESGTLYETLMDAMGWAPDRRDEFKANELFSVLYGDPTNFGWRTDGRGKLLPPSELKPMLAERYPNVWKFIVEYHQQHGHGELARELQRQEARLMIRGVCGRLIEEHSDCPLITVHDAILTTAPWVATVQQVILDEFGKLGIRPTLKVKPPHTMPHVPATMPTVTFGLS